MPRWDRLCQDCWQHNNPNDYLPENSVGFDTCVACGYDALTYAHHNRHEPADPLVTDLPERLDSAEQVFA